MSEGDKVGGDKVGGDKVDGDKYHIDNGIINREADHIIQMLDRVREAAIGMGKNHIWMLYYRETHEEINERYIDKFAEHSSYWSELRGLAFAIQDKELLDLINKPYGFDVHPNRRNAMMDEMEIRGRTQQIHTRIAQLIDERMKR